MKVLLLVDIQKDFLEGGSLAVPNGNEVIPIANKLIDSGKFNYIIASKDWHPKGHCSFASNHLSMSDDATIKLIPLKEEGLKPFTTLNVNGIDQILWPDHCIQSSTGAAFPKSLKAEKINSVIFKGTDVTVDSYSAFSDANRKETGLTNLLNRLWKRQDENLDLYIMGLATDYCVFFTALDAITNGFNNFSFSKRAKTHLIIDGCRGISQEDVESKIKALQEVNISIIESENI